jgi:DNA-binding CsgD family transcriptional regulator
MKYSTKYHVIVSVIVALLIVVLTIASILNIVEQTRNYHEGAQILYIGIGFAASFAVTVYIVMISRTKTTKIVASFFALVFGYVSGTIQQELYLASGAPVNVALAYGFGVPAFEAALAILEALLNLETMAAVAPIAKSAVQKTQRKIAKVQPEKVQEVAGSQVQKAQSEVQEIAIRPQAFEALGMQENGMTIAEIAEKLRKSERTVSNYLKTAKGQKVAIHSNGHTAEVAS